MKKVLITIFLPLFVIPLSTSALTAPDQTAPKTDGKPVITRPADPGAADENSPGANRLDQYPEEYRSLLVRVIVILVLALIFVFLLSHYKRRDKNVRLRR